LKKTSAKRLLKYYQTWRLGADIRMMEPKLITKVLDYCINERESKCNHILGLHYEDFIYTKNIVDGFDLKKLHDVFIYCPDCGEKLID
jgi:hypothetical protein